MTPRRSPSPGTAAPAADEDATLPEEIPDIADALGDRLQYFRILRKRANGQFPEDVGRLERTEYSEDTIRARFGGGDFQVRIFARVDSGRTRQVASRSVAIAGPFKDFNAPLPPAAAAPAPPPPAARVQNESTSTGSQNETNVDARLRRLERALSRTLRELRQPAAQLNAQPPQDMFAQFRQFLEFQNLMTPKQSQVLSDPIDSMLKLATLSKELSPNPPGFTEGLELGRRMRAGVAATAEHTTSVAEVLPQVLGPLAKLMDRALAIEETKLKMAAAAPRGREIPQPPKPDPAAPGQQPPAPNWAQELAQAAPLILSWADRGKDPVFYAAFALEELTDSQYEQIAEAAEINDFGDQVLQAIPELQRQREWVLKFFEAMRKELLEAEPEPETE